MNKDKIPFHYVCTHEEAEELVRNHKRHWVSNCGYREESGKKCRRSRIDLCLMFRNDLEPSGSDMHEASAEEVRSIFEEAKEKQLVTRPVRKRQHARN